MSQIFFTYEQQLHKLITEKNLTIPDKLSAQNILKKIGYFPLISGYKKPFKHLASKKYKYGVTFDEIVSLYYFDEEIRTLFLKYILHIERYMKSAISYYFCNKYGEKQDAYLTPDNYTLTKKNTPEINKLVHSLEKAISLPNPYPYITHHALKYNNVPLWVAMNAFTFGQVSKIYQYIPNDIQYKISKDFPHITERELHQFITVLARCRNVCAHNERLFSFHIRETIPDTTLHHKLEIPRKKGQFIKGKQDLFSVVITLRYLLDNEEFKQFKSQLVRHINHVLKLCPHLTREQLYSEMGFPENWNRITYYKR